MTDRLFHEDRDQGRAVNVYPAGDNLWVTVGDDEGGWKAIMLNREAAWKLREVVTAFLQATTPPREGPTIPAGHCEDKDVPLGPSPQEPPGG